MWFHSAIASASESDRSWFKFINFSQSIKNLERKQVFVSTSATFELMQNMLNGYDFCSRPDCFSENITE